VGGLCFFFFPPKNFFLKKKKKNFFFYLGITRAKEQLFLSYTRERSLWGNTEPAQPSQFLDELPPELITGKEVSNAKVASNHHNGNWQIGDRVLHPSFGEGIITNLFTSGRKTTLAVKFPGIGKKIIDPTLAKLQSLV